jgi:divalent metal cation (Fe/Co/Zn/Cd) transporter
LIGESAASWVAERIRSELGRSGEIKTINEVATLHMGPEFILVTISVDFAEDMNADQVEACVAQLTRRIKAIDPTLRRVFIEAERRVDHQRELDASGAQPGS